MTNSLVMSYKSLNNTWCINYTSLRQKNIKGIGWNGSSITVSSNFLLDKGRVAENLQKECFCYFIIKGIGIPIFRDFTSILHVLLQNIVFRNLFRLKCLIGQTSHGTVYTAFFNIRWKKGNRTENNIFQFFVNFRTFCPKTWLSATPNELHFWCVLQSIQQYMLH